jgi:hypothetical protein
MFQKIKVLFYILFYGLSIQSQNNSLVIFSEFGSPFYLKVNHEQINKIAQSNLKVFNLTSGVNLIEIKFQVDDKQIELKDSILISSNSKLLGKEFTYVLQEKEGKLQLQFKSTSELSGPSVPPVPEAPKEVIPLIDNSIYGNLYQAVNNKPNFYNNYDDETSTCKVLLTDKDITYAINLFKKVNDGEIAYKYLNQILELNCYTVLQLKNLLEFTVIDIDRLNSAKKGYTHILDVENISTLFAIFKYQTMKESFFSFIKDQENIKKQKSLNCKSPISDSKFDDLLAKIKKAPYENEKLIISKKLLIEVCLSSSQIIKLSELFTHDREKLEFMKTAYAILTDKENATLLADQFQFKETKEELLKYITK